MKDKIVFWGVDEQEKDILVTLRLRASENTVDIWTFPKAGLSEEFVEKMFQDWDNIKVEDFPESTIHYEHNMNEPSLLPDHIKAKDTDIVRRAEREWYVRILSAKLSQKLDEEITQLAEQVKTITNYDKDIWDTARSYWEKVNQYFQSRDLTREHAGKLRDNINICFDKLKKLRKIDNERYVKEAQEAMQSILTRIEEIGVKVAGATNLNILFQNLKGVQEELKNQRMPRDFRFKAKTKLDEVFQLIRTERANSRFHRLNKRIDGLQNAITRMEKSLKRDHDDLKFQEKRIRKTDGKLEAQLREAKIVMINGRIESKEVKLKDMYLTRDKLEADLLKEKRRAEEAAAKAAAEAVRKKAEAEERAAKAAAETERRKAAAEEKAAIEAAKKAETEEKSKVAVVEKEIIATEEKEISLQQEEAIKSTESTDSPKDMSIVSEEVENVTESTEE